MKSLESKFRRSQRTHSFIDCISLAQTPTPEPVPEPQIVPLRNSQPDIPREPRPAHPETEVLEGLREDWLSRASTPKPEAEASAAKTGRKKPRKQPHTMAKYAPFLASVKASVRKRVPRRSDLHGAEGKSAAKVTVGMFAGLAVLILSGALIYAATVSSIFDSTQFSVAAQEDSPNGPAAATLATAGQTTQSSALPAIAPENKSDPDAANAGNAGYTLNGGPAALPTPQLDPATLDALNAHPFSSPAANSTLGSPLAGPAGDVAAWARDEQTRDPAPAPPATPANPPSVAPAHGLLPSGSRQPAANDARAASYLSLVHTAEGSLAKNDLLNAYRSAEQAKAVDPNRLPALELVQTVLARAGNPTDAQASALDAIAHGGKAIFELQHFHASPAALHPAKIVITATTLQFVPEGPCTTGGFTIPLASITTVQMRQSSSGLYLLNIRFNASGEPGARAAKGELSFRDASSQFRNVNPAQLSSRLSTAQETALFTAIRNVLLAPNGRT